MMKHSLNSSPNLILGPTIKRAVIFTLVQILGWFIAWLAGFNFDERNATVAYWALVVITFGGMAAAWS